MAAKKTIEIEARARDAGRSRGEMLSYRGIEGCTQHAQHDCRGRHVGIGLLFLLMAKRFL